jgi:DNA-binding FadR family transcriptional regulator
VLPNDGEIITVFPSSVVSRPERDEHECDVLVQASGEAFEALTDVLRGGSVKKLICCYMIGEINILRGDLADFLSRILPTSSTSSSLSSSSGGKSTSSGEVVSRPSDRGWWLVNTVSSFLWHHFLQFLKYWIGKRPKKLQSTATEAAASAMMEEERGRFQGIGDYKDDSEESHAQLTVIDLLRQHPIPVPMTILSQLRSPQHQIFESNSSNGSGSSSSSSSSSKVEFFLAIAEFVHNPFIVEAMLESTAAILFQQQQVQVQQKQEEQQEDVQKRKELLREWRTREWSKVVRKSRMLLDNYAAVLMMVLMIDVTAALEEATLINN